MSNSLPKLSIVIPTFNEEANIERCLKAVFEQDYSHDRLEVFVIDGGSTDRTVELAKKYPIIYLFNAKKLAEPAKILGFSKSSGDLFFYLDADLFLARKDWITKLVKPLMEDGTLVGSFTRFVPETTDPPLNRYLSYQEFHLDPLLEHVCYPLEKTFIEKRPEYRVCWFEPGKTPPIGICIYRRGALKALIDQTPDFEWVDIAMPVILSRAGHHRFAYTEDAGMYHLTVKTLGDLLRQKQRDALVTFLPALDKRDVTYVNFDQPSDIIKILLWIVYANLVLPATVRAIQKAVKYRDLACLYEIIVMPLVTDYVLWLFLSSPYGRALAGRVLRRLFGFR